MIRGKLKERFGKTEETKSTDSAEEQQTIPDETTEEINQEEQDETTSVKKLSIYLYLSSSFFCLLSFVLFLFFKIDKIN